MVLRLLHFYCLLKQPVVQRGNIKGDEADQRDSSITQTHFLRMSCFFCSSDVGRPMDFCLWSYIIFSTIPRVSPSRSDSCSGEGGTNEAKRRLKVVTVHVQNI